MDKIKTTLEINGITMTCNGANGQVHISYKHVPTPAVYNLNYNKAPIETSVFEIPFYIECKDDPSKLHKFCEMKYLGLVDNPHYKLGDLLRETVKKFDGCLVYSHGQESTLITKKNLFRLGCSQGVFEVLGYVFTGVFFQSGSSLHEISFNRIDASKIPVLWAWSSAHNKVISSLCEQLKDVEP